MHPAKFSTKLELNPHREVRRYMYQYPNPITIIPGLHLNHLTLPPETTINE